MPSPTLLAATCCVLFGACSFDRGGLATGGDLGVVDQRADVGDSGDIDLGDATPPETSSDVADGPASEGLPDGSDGPVPDGQPEAGPDISPDSSPDVGPDLPPAPTCTDGKKNGTETDIDCGGTCPACSIGKKCKTSSDCGGNICGATQTCRYPVSCGELHSAHPSLGTGTYSIQPATSGSSFSTGCDMVTDGGGWTLIMRTVWDWSQSQLLMSGWDDFYDKSAGVVVGAYRLPGKHWPALAAGGSMLFALRGRTASGAACSTRRFISTGLSIKANVAKRELSLSGATPAFGMGSGVSTLDSGPSPHCVKTVQSVPWFLANCCEICPTLGGYWPTPRPTIVKGLSTLADIDGKTLATACGAIPPALTASGHYGADLIEFYLR